MTIESENLTKPPRGQLPARRRFCLSAFWETAENSVIRSVCAAVRAALRAQRAPFVSALSFLHFAPVQKAVQIVGKEHHKTDDDGKIGKIFDGGERPQHDEHDVVRGVGERIIGAAAEGQVHREKARRHRDGARDEVGGMQGF